MGPVCPYVLAPVARYSGKWNIPVLSTGGQASSFRQKEQYPLLTTMGGNYEQFAVFFTKLLQKFEWYVLQIERGERAIVDNRLLLEFRINLVP